MNLTVSGRWIKYKLLAFIMIVMAEPSVAQLSKNKILQQDSTVTIGVLKNGLTYYIRPNSKPEKKVELRLVVNAGSILETDAQQGLAHFVEHMEFNGLKHFPGNTLTDYLQRIGVRFGADLNATTEWDKTTYILPIPTDNPKNLEQGFQIIADWMDGAQMLDDQIRKERLIILEELRMRLKSADGRILNAYIPAMLNGSKYAFRLAGGKDSIVANCDPELIRKFYRDWYRPDLMAVVIVGDISTLKAKQLINKYFSNIYNPSSKKKRPYYDVLPYTEKKAMIVTDPEASRYGFSLFYPTHKRLPLKTLDDFRQRIIDNIVSQGLNRKLRDVTQAANPPCTYAGVKLGGDIGGISLRDEGLQLDITPVTDMKMAIQAGIGQLMLAARFGFSAVDIELAKKTLLSAYQNAYAERENIQSALLADGYASAFIHKAKITSIANDYNNLLKVLPGITVEEVNARTLQLCKAPPAYFALISGPEKKESTLFTDLQLREIVDSAFLIELKPQTSEAGKFVLLAEEPKGGKIISSKKDEQLGTTTYQLSNGVKVTVKPTNYRKEQILFSGIKYGGSNMYDFQDKSNVSVLTSVIEAMGYGQLTPTALSDYLSDKNVNVGVTLGGIVDQIGGGGISSELETMLKLAYVKLTQPRKDTMLFKGLHNKMSAQLPLINADPQNLFRDSLNKVMYNGNPNAPMFIPTQADLDAINTDRVIQIYQTQFGYADGFHFFFVGSIDTAKIKPLIEKYLGGLPTTGTPMEYKDNGVRIVKGNQLFEFRKGKDKKSVLMDIYHGDCEYSADLALKATMLAQVMSIQIIDTIREKMQAIYGGSAVASLHKIPHSSYSFVIQMPCAPENVDKIFHELDKEIAAFKKEGVSQNDLDKVKKAMIEGINESANDNGNWMTQIQQILFWGADKNDYLRLKERVNKVTVADLKEVANLLFGNNNFRAVSYPE